VPLPSTSSDRNGSKVAGASPDNCVASTPHKASKEEQGRHVEESEQDSSCNPAAPGNKTCQAKGVKSRQPSFIASCDEENAQARNAKVLIPQISIYIDEEPMNTTESTTTV
jgi:hypothetical protein